MGLYDALDSSGPELCAALSVVAATTEDTPLAFYCKAGKDRTGLVAALSLHCCGASDEMIIADYHRSHAQAARGAGRGSPGTSSSVTGGAGVGLGGGNIEAFSSSARGLGIDYSRFHGAPEVGMSTFSFDVFTRTHAHPHFLFA